MYERFTDRARRVMQLANQEAQRFHHEYIGTEHILLGLLREQEGVAAQVLMNLGVRLDQVREEVLCLLRMSPQNTPNPSPSQEVPSPRPDEPATRPHVSPRAAAAGICPVCGGPIGGVRFSAFDRICALAVFVVGMLLVVFGVVGIACGVARLVSDWDAQFAVSPLLGTVLTLIGLGIVRCVYVAVRRAPASRRGW